MPPLCAILGEPHADLCDRISTYISDEAARWPWTVSQQTGYKATFWTASLPGDSDQPKVTSDISGNVTDCFKGFSNEQTDPANLLTSAEIEDQLLIMGGLFVWFHALENADSWVIAPDRGAYSPLYYRELEGRLLVSTEVKYLLVQQPPAINSTSLTSLLTLGYMLGKDTLFEGIYRFLPGEYLKWSSDRLTKHNYWSMSDYEVRDRLSKETLDCETRELVIDRIARTFDKTKNAHVLLSGGLDSRWIAAVGSTLCDSTRIRSTCAVKPNSWKDSKLAPQVARVLGLEHSTLTFSWESIYEGLVDKVWCTDGLCSEHLWAMQLVPHLTGQDIVYDGFCGDPLMSGTYETEEKKALFEKDIDWTIRCRQFTGATEDLGLFIEGYDSRYADFGDKLHQHVSAERESPSPSLTFGLRHRMRNAMSLMECNIWEQGASLRYPFVDAVLQDCLFTLAPEDRSGARLNQAMLDIAYPTLASIRSTHEQGSAKRSIGKRISQRAHKLRFRFKADNRASHQFLESCKRAQVVEKLRLFNLLEIPEPFNRDAIRDNLESGGLQQYGGWDRILTILQILVWYNLFVLGRPHSELAPPTAYSNK